MSLLSICQQVANECAIVAPATIINNSDDTAVRLLAFAQREGKMLSQKYDWSTLQREHTFTTANGTAYYDLPSDFRHMLNETVWNRSQFWDVRGGLSPQEWQEWKSSFLGGSTYRNRYRLKPVAGVDKFYIDPTPADAEDYVFEYMSNSWCQSAGGAAQTEWTADSDTARISEHLIELGVVWRMLQGLGMDYGDQRAQYENEVIKAYARDNGGYTLDQSLRRNKFVFRIPETGAGGI